MIKMILLPIPLALVVFGIVSAAAPIRWEKLSDHFYSYQCKSDSLNVAAVVSDEGILLINPPAEPDLSEALYALKKISPRQIRWVVATDPRISGGMAPLADQGVTLIGSLAQKSSNLMTAPAMAFEKQMRLFPAGFEVRVMAVQHKAHSSADLVVLLPSEKLVYVGDLYSQNAFPVIDEEADGGSAQDWVDGLKQVLDSVPLLKPAIPPAPKTPPKVSAPKAPPQPEKTLEEEYIVVPGHGPRSNYMEMKALHEMALRVRSEVTRLAGGSLARENLLGWPSFSAYRSYPGFENFALQIYDAAKRKKGTVPF